MVFVCMMAVVNFASAEIIRGIDIDFVNIGNAGNAANITSGRGSVGYNYRIGTYEVTNAQWNTFTAAAGAPTGSDGGYASSSHCTGDQQPVNMVSWYEAAQFCNYLTSGDKSKGAYQFSGSNAAPGYFQGINRTAAQATYGTIYVVPTEDEWYKAAYFKPDDSGYSLYADGTNTAPIAGVNSNYNAVIGSPWDVGTGTMEQNGTYDIMGNVWQWNEALSYGSCRGLRGGAYDCCYASYLASSSTGSNSFQNIGSGDVGFRVVSIPEPASAAIMTLAGLFITLKRRKR